MDILSFSLSNLKLFEGRNHVIFISVNISIHLAFCRHSPVFVELIHSSVQQAQVNAYKKPGADVNRDENPLPPNFLGRM